MRASKPIHPRWRGRRPALRWTVQRLSDRARGRRDAFTLPHVQFWCDTADDVRLAGTLLGSPATDDTVVVLVHGFMGYRTKRPWRALAEGLAERTAVATFDLRGHGQSQGACSGGELEVQDVQAVVDLMRARGFKRIVTVGGSLGGIAVLGQAAAARDIDAVVAISTPAFWASSQTKAVRRATWLFTSPVGRALARGVMGTTISLGWGNPPPPADVVGKIAPVPLLIVHGEDDHFFPASDARALYERAGDPKRLLLLPAFGHAEDGFTPAFADLLSREIASLLAIPRG